MRTKRAWILVVAMTAAGAACSTSGGGDAASPATTSRPSDATTTSSAKTTSTADATTSSTADTITSTTKGSETGASGTACDLLSPSDLTSAGIEGKISEDGDVSKNFNLGSSITSTACAYTVAQGNSSIGLTVVVAQGVEAGAIDDATGFADNPQDDTAVGNRAVYNEEDGMGEATENMIWAEQGGRLVKVSSVDADVTPKATLEALARKILGA